MFYLFAAMFFLFSALIGPFGTGQIRKVKSSGIVYAAGSGAGSGMWKDFDVKVEKDGPSVSGVKDSQDSWQKVLDKYKGFISGFAGVGAITMVALFIKNFISLGASSGNPSARANALVGVLWTGIAAAGLGAVSLITGVFYRFLF